MECVRFGNDVDQLPRNEMDSRQGCSCNNRELLYGKSYTSGHTNWHMCIRRDGEFLDYVLCRYAGLLEVPQHLPGRGFFPPIRGCNLNSMVLRVVFADSRDVCRHLAVVKLCNVRQHEKPQVTDATYLEHCYRETSTMVIPHHQHTSLAGNDTCADRLWSPLRRSGGRASFRSCSALHGGRVQRSAWEAGPLGESPEPVHTASGVGAAVADARYEKLGGRVTDSEHRGFII